MDPKFECPKCGEKCIWVHVWKTTFGTCDNCKVAWEIGEIVTVPDEIKVRYQENYEFLKRNYENITDEF